VADETIQAIDRVFDLIDKGVDAADRVLNRGKQSADRGSRTLDQHKPRRAKPAVIDAEATLKTEPVKTTAVVRKPHFHIVETTDPKSGSALFVVTDGGAARTECTTREFANQILRALEKAK
jgi:hypothetical protein